MLKGLKEIGLEDFVQAEQTGWVLYLEGATDLAILRTIANRLDHPARAVLEQAFVKDVQNQAQDHFYGLREAKPDLVGYALYDRLSSPPRQCDRLRQRCWSRKKIENCIVDRAVLLSWARAVAAWEKAMGKGIAEVEGAL